MSGILSTVLILGGLGVAVYLVIHRCDLLHFCDQGAAGATAPDPSPAATALAKKGCCKCVQKDAKTIHCTTSSGLDLSFTGGLSLDAQIAACNADRKICPAVGDTLPADIKATSAGQTQTTDAVSQAAGINICASKRCKDHPKDFICVQSGCHNSVIKNLTKNVRDTSSSPCGCKPGQLAVTTPGIDPVTKKPANICGKCFKANYVRQSYFADTDNFRAFRDRISYN